MLTQPHEKMQIPKGLAGNNTDVFMELQKFRHVRFREDIHKYTINGVQCPISTTGLISKFHEKFNEDYWADRKALEYGLTSEHVKNCWKYINKHAIAEGRTFHNFAEYWMNGKELPYPEREIRMEFDGVDPIRGSHLMMREQFIQFHKDIVGKLLPIVSEFVMGDQEFMLGGMLDQLFWSHTKQEFQIWDWKTNGKMEMHSNNCMYDPISHIPDSNYWHYCLQLSIYKYMIEKWTNLKIGNMFIVWFNEKNESYQIIQVKPLMKEVQDMLEYEFLGKSSK